MKPIQPVLVSPAQGAKPLLPAIRRDSYVPDGTMPAQPGGAPKLAQFVTNVMKPQAVNVSGAAAPVHRPQVVAAGTQIKYCSLVMYSEYADYSLDLLVCLALQIHVHCTRATQFMYMYVLRYNDNTWLLLVSFWKMDQRLTCTVGCRAEVDLLLTYPRGVVIALLRKCMFFFQST